MKELIITIRRGDYQSALVEVDDATYAALASSAEAARVYAVSVIERGDCDPKSVGESEVEVVDVSLIDPVSRDSGDFVLYAEDQP